jgi:hypothetical protein
MSINTHFHIATEDQVNDPHDKLKNLGQQRKTLKAGTDGLDQESYG